MTHRITQTTWEDVDGVSWVVTIGWTRFQRWEPVSVMLEDSDRQPLTPYLLRAIPFGSLVKHGRLMMNGRTFELTGVTDFMELDAT